MQDKIEQKEKYILVAVATGDEQAAWDSLEELEELLETAGAEASSMLVQNLEHPDRATYIGSGKVLEVKEMLAQQDAVGIVCDDELSPSQVRNLSDRLESKVLDRTLLILDIFAAHAKTKEGKIQVEIAQLKYRSSRLRGWGEALSRLGGGIGTRGPGETKLETDRRVIQRRIKILSDEIDAMKRVRDTTRKKRSASMIPTLAIVGYSNAGKSTLLNCLTEADVLSEDKLFATLDPTTRTAVLPDGQQVLMTDTVGFINKLPHHLVDAFRSTLEEAKYADVILHVIDASNPQAELQRKVALATLEDLGVVGKPVITAWNKMDKVETKMEEGLWPETDEGLWPPEDQGGLWPSEDQAGLWPPEDQVGRGPCEDQGGLWPSAAFRDFEADASVQISALTGEGIPELYEAIAHILGENRVYLETVLDYKDSGKLAQIRKYGQLLEEKYEGDGIHIKAYVPRSLV